MNFISNTVVVMTKVVVGHVAAGKSLVRRDHSGHPPGNSAKSASLSRLGSQSVQMSTRDCTSEYDEEQGGGGVDEEFEQHQQLELEEDSEEDNKRTAPERLDVCLEFKDLFYSVPHSSTECRACKLKIQSGGDSTDGSDHDDSVIRNDGDVKILQKVSGRVRAGELMAIVGPSGAGKSTLIDALAQRISPISLQGSITLNGEEVKSNSVIRNISAYVMQDDLLFPMLTVKETLRFAAELRLSNNWAEKIARVNEVLKQLNLAKVANTIIGDEGHRGISGGERRRVSIGKGIIHNPLLLFLDEPTSGLDSTNALLVLDTLKRIARTGSMIVLSMHQPSERMLKLITTVLFIAEGHIIFNGPPTSLQGYFETYLGNTIPAGTNTTEYALDLVQEYSVNSRCGLTPLVQSFRRFSQVLTQHKDGEEAVHDAQSDCITTCDTESPRLTTGVKGALHASISRGKLFGATGFLKQYRGSEKYIQKFANSRSYEIYVLAWRGMLNIRRTPELFLIRFLTVIFSGFLLATIFWQLDYSTQGLRERLGFYAFAISTAYYICVDTLPSFLQERHIFMRETAHDSYRISSYVLAIALINIPFLFFLAFAFSVTTFWTVGLSGDFMGYFFFLLVLWASFWAGNSFATLLSALISNVITGYTIVVAALAYFLLLSGFFIEKNRIPRYWLWLHYVSLVKYPYEAALLNEFDRSSSVCYETADHILSGTPFQGMHKVTDSILRHLRVIFRNTKYRHLNGSSCLINGAAVLRSQDIGELDKWTCLAVTVSFGLLYRLCFYIVLRYSGKLNRR